MKPEAPKILVGTLLNFHVNKIIDRYFKLQSVIWLRIVKWVLRKARPGLLHVAFHSLKPVLKTGSMWSSCLKVSISIQLTTAPGKNNLPYFQSALAWFSAKGCLLFHQVTVTQAKDVFCHDRRCVFKGVSNKRAYWNNQGTSICRTFLDSKSRWGYF